MNHTRRNVLLLAACQALMFSGNSLLITTSALIGYDLLGTDKSLATLPMALQMIATLASSIPASLLMGRIGRRAGFALGSLLGMAGGLCGAYALYIESFALFCVTTMLVGAFNGFAIYYRFAAADQADAKYKSKAISYVLGGGVIAAFIGPNLAAWTRDVTEVLFGGSMLCLIGFYSLSLALQLFLVIPKPGVVDNAAPRRSMAMIAGQPRFVIAVCCGMLGYGAMTLIMTATPLAMQAIRLPFTDTAFVIQWHVFAMFAPSFFTGHLINRFGLTTVMLTGALLDLICIAVNLSGASVWHFSAGLVLLGLGWNFLFIGATTLLTDTYRPSERAKAQAFNDFFVFTSTTASALTAGTLQHHLGWETVNLSALPVLAVIMLALVWLQFGAPRVSESG
ncbi:MAG: MFS transporter [Gammaproteobacteria bacterium]|nr:MFS transporter [Gammaproteobacteria bacterium]